MLAHATPLLAKLPALMLLLTLLLSSVWQIHAGVIKKRETVSTLHTVVSNGSSSMENANAKFTSNSLNPVLSTRLTPEKGSGGGSLVLSKVDMETLQKSSDNAENQENKVVLEVPKPTEMDIAVKLDKVIADITLPAPITKPPNDISKNAYEVEAFTAAAVEATTIASHKSTELEKNAEVFSHVNSANIEFASDNKISDSLDLQALNVKTGALNSERVSEATLPTVSVTDHASSSMPHIDVGATTSQPESIAISLHNPQTTQATKKPIIPNELQTNELLKYNDSISIASNLTTLPEIEVTTTLAPLTAINTTILHTPNDSTTAQRATSSAEKRAKFINDNSTNTNKLQLPNSAEVWTLAGLKSVMMQHASGSSTTTERAPTESSSNSEKNLLDWTQIMLAMNDGKQAAIDKTFDNLIDSSTMANKVKKSGNSNETIEDYSTTNYMPAATMSIEFKTELNDAAPVTTVIPNVAANSVLNIETTTIAIDADTLSAATTSSTTTTTTTTTTTPLSIDKSLDNKGSTLASANSSETTTERAVTNEMSVHSSTNEQLNSSLTELKATTTTQSILDLPEAEKTMTATTTTTAEADKPGVTVEYTTTAMPLPDKHFSSSTSVQPPPATSAGSTAETNSKSSNLNEHANSASDDTFSTTLEHNSSDTVTLSTPIASVVNTTIAIEENTQKTKKEDEEIAVTTTTLEQLGTATTTTPPRTTTIDTDLLATVSATTAPITKTTTEANNHNWNEVDLDIGTEQTTKTSSTQATTTKSKEADETTTTSAAINLLITTTTTTTTKAPPATTPNQALPTLVTESVSAVNETTIAKEEQQQQQHVATTTSTPAVLNTTITTTTTTTTTTPTSIEDNIGLEKPHETHESSIETNSIDSVEKTIKNNEDTTTAPNTVAITTTSDVENNNEDMLLHTSSTNSSTIIPTSIIFTTSTTPSTSTSTTTTTEAPLISLLDDILTTTTTIAPQLTPPAAPPVGATTENNEMNSVYSSTTAATVPITATTEVIPNSTIFNTLTTLIPKLIDTTSTEMPTATATTTTTTSRNIIYEAPPPHLYGNKDSSSGGADSPETDVNVIIAISVSCIGIVALVLLVAFLYVMRKRQKQMSYGQRCRPVSLDAYSMDNVSVFNSVRRKGAARSSKRSYGNVAFDDPSLKHHLLGAVDLSKFIERRISIFEEFRDVPQITARADEVPKGCEDKNRYANVIPLPETRVILQQQNDDEKTEYINANYVRGPRDAPNYYIACQAPLESTVADFWRMIWEQQSRVIIQATDLIENGIEKCAEYLPPSVTIDNHVTYGDYQITLKNREVKDKYAISTIMLKNIVENTSRELTHYWYKWPEAGVPQEEAPIIAMLLEARSSLKSYAIEQANELKEKSSTLTIKSDAAKEMTLSVTSLEKSDEQKETSSASGSQNGEINGNVSTDKLKAAARNQGPLTVHCSPGTGRTGTIIGCDMAIRCLETPKRNVDIPQIVYYVRRGRASAVQTKEQYEFIYKVANMYATKITNLSNDN